MPRLSRRRRRPHVGHPTFIDGLRLTNVLERHSGCVNALAWNDDATLLLSGSDDLCVCVWSTGAGFPCRGSVYTGHVNNIFSNEFVPHSGSARCVTTAGDGDVRLVDLERGVSSIELCVDCTGKSGVAIHDADTLATALNGVRADIASVALDHCGHLSETREGAVHVGGRHRLLPRTP